MYKRQELEYLEYLKDLPNNKSAADKVLNELSWLLAVSSQSPIANFELIFGESRDKIKERAMHLYQEAINFYMDHGDSERKKEKLDKSREYVPRWDSATDMMAKRRSHDQLDDQLTEVFDESRKGKGDKFAIHNRVDFLRKIDKLRDKHNELVSDRCTPLYKKLGKIILDVVNGLQYKMSKCTGDAQSRTEAIALISRLKKKGCLDEQRQNIYSGCTQLRDLVRHPVKMGKITSTQFNGMISDIYSMANKKDYMAAAKELVQLLVNHEHEVKTFPQESRNKLAHRIFNIKTTLHAALFAPVFNAYKNAIHNFRGSYQSVAFVMHEHKDRFIKLGPYLHLFLLDNKKIQDWQNIACLAWLNDIDELCRKTSFSEYDIDDLLHLKDIAPSMPHISVRNRLQEALVNIFSFMSHSNPNAALVEKVMKLSQWVDDLDNHHGISYALSKNNKEWQKKYMSMAGEGATASSGASAGIMPSFAHSSTMSASLEAFGYHPGMGQWNAPHMMQPLTTIFSAPAPATLPAYRLEPMQILPAPHCMPASATQQPFQQPVLFPGHRTTAQSPDETRPQPLSAHHNVSTVWQLTGSEMMPHF